MTAWPILGIVLVIAATVALLANRPVPASARSSECAGHSGVPESAVHEPIRLKIDDGDTTLVFGPYRRPRELALRAGFVDAGVPAAGTLVNFDISQLVRGDGAQIPSDQVQVVGCVGRDGQHVAILLQVDPQTVSGGTYTGTLQVDDASFDSAHSTPVKVTVTLQDPRRVLVLFLVVLAVLAAVVIQLLTRVFEIDPARRRADAGNTRRLWGMPLSFVEFGVGLSAALLLAVPVYLAKYLNDPAWTLDTTHSWNLLTAVFAAASVTYPAGVAAVRRQASAAEGSAGS